VHGEASSQGLQAEVARLAAELADSQRHALSVEAENEDLRERLHAASSPAMAA